MYYLKAANALSMIRDAIAQAVATLPKDVLALHWQASQHSPAPWRSVEAHYLTRPDADPAIATTLTNLALMYEALMSMVAVSSPATSTTSPSLKLAKVRRSAV